LYIIRGKWNFFPLKKKGGGKENAFNVSRSPVKECVFSAPLPSRAYVLQKMMNDRANGAFMAGEYLKFIETKDTIPVEQFVAFVQHK
jgi:hypothetical protein